MPYIPKEDREKWGPIIEEIKAKLKDIPENMKEGELNYLISKLLKESYEPSYFNYNRATGLLECIKQEFYRKEVVPYEEMKEKLNGSI